MAAYFVTSENPTLNLDSVKSVISTDPVIWHFINDYFEIFLNNDKALDQNIGQTASVKQATLPAAGWSSTAPYKQTVKVDGITANDVPVITQYLEAELTADTVKARNKAFSMLDRAVTGAGSITFWCYNKKPTADITVQIKGV